MTSVADNLDSVRHRIDAACLAAGRDPSQVSLLPVSKTHPASAVLDAVAAGYTRFGENRVQEAMGKWQELHEGHPEIEWVIIGHLQTNKARDVARFATEVSSLDSVKLAHDLARRLDREGRQIDVLIEVNSSGEPQKSGVAPSEAPALARELVGMDTLRVKGLMTVAVNSPDRARVAACFQTMQDLQQRLRQEAPATSSWDELSMGMSGDFEQAIAHGATVVRVGTAIFGARDYS
ncbi:YggS family pyridoxal phosphate-dependent enzyme [Acidipropionibacterium jensenii]|uniref:Pyridoxal phosphate homeostasis protein n=1 Tax=Acidipropionibacterium jensenii TaxID=1749 RepID=A0A3Q9UI09_9ACTN|nr:YggS family pyridoxal phosphate-dependent enzyme [Acidipropionibacterium jensenii]AZZ39599.1 YggS family pyridoxal phosphate-dependent enzyme [Acidipropionibacterium jensenii]AZZ41976.1 YggS family pyridoxal phosphate-dependent enzyme [Acidipropionibacterium jensenii]